MLDTTSGGAGEVGIPSINVWNEGLHGIADNCGVAFAPPTSFSTSFPMAITSSMSFNASLWRAIGAAIATEGRAFSNAGHSGLTFWSPTVNLYRDPRWGRGQETPGEDPLVSSTYAVQYISGMQEGTDPRYLKVSATAKHLAAYSLEKWNNTDRYHFNAEVTDADLVEYYLQPFQAAVQQGRVSAVMCSYNALNGVPTCANDFLLTTILREQWGFDGYVTSDCGAVGDIPDAHKYTNSTSATAAATLKAGMDIGCDSYLHAPGVITGALADGSIAQADLDTAMSHLFSVRMRTGEFDAVGDQPYMSIPPSAICSPAHVELARDGARQSIVLLTNPKGALPLSRAAVTSIAIVGPLANNTYINGGPNYNGVPCGGVPSTVLSALSAGTTAAIAFQPGCDDGVPCGSTGGFAAAASAAAASDVTVVVVGIDATLENEGLDRTSIDLPGHQGDLVTATCAAAKGPCVLVAVSGGAIDVSAVLPSATGGAWYTGLPGGVGADALVDLLFGDAVPSGRLTQTVYGAAFVESVSLFDMNVRPGPSAWPPGTNPGRTYKWFTGAPVFPFGYGLSLGYTTWNVTLAEGPSTVSLAPVAAFLEAHPGHGGALAPTLGAPSVASYRVNVSNTGARDADYSVLGFVSAPGAGTNGIPLQELFAFQRVHVPVGQTVSVWLGLGARFLTRLHDSDGAVSPGGRISGLTRSPVPGTYTLRFGVEAAGQAWAEATLVAVA